MKNKVKLIVLTLFVSVGLSLGTSAAVNNSKPVAVKTPVIQKPAPIVPEAVYPLVSSLDVAANPTKYLHKNIRIRAKFDKFSTLGLDYKPAYRNSEKYITFLIKRDDVINHTVPLSEMKNFLAREIAEKYIDLKPGDLVEYSGVVFSDALGDAWVSVEKFNVLSQKAKTTETEKK